MHGQASCVVRGSRLRRLHLTMAMVGMAERKHLAILRRPAKPGLEGRTRAQPTGEAHS